MRAVRIFLLFTAGWFLCAPASPATQAPAAPAPVPLVLTGGTLIDVTDWGHSAKDLTNAVVIIQADKIIEVGPASAVVIPKGARIIDCTGKFILPGLVDGYMGMNSQGEASASLYMGVTTAVVASNSRRGRVDFAVSPAPHLYPIDSVGTTDDWSRLIGHSDWTSTLRVLGGHPTELSPEDTQRQLADTAKLGTRVVYLGHNLTAVNTQWIIARAHSMGLVTYGEFISTPYHVGIEAGVDALMDMGRYDLGVVPDELQQPLVDDPEGPSASTAYDYSERLPPTDLHVARYARFIAAHHSALMPMFATYFLRLPGHRNLWNDPAAALMNPARMSNPPNHNGEMDYPLPAWARHLPGFAQRDLEESQRKKADQSALRLWHLNQAIFSAYPHYLAASGAPVDGSFPGISLQVELEMLVRLGLTPRESLAAATNNYALQFNWTELGQVAPGRRADILVLDGDPTANIWNARRISTLILDGNVIDRQALVKKP